MDDAALSHAGVTGFIFGLGLIGSLGPQNLMLIRAGMTRSFPIAVASTGYLSEIVLVALGTGGLAAAINQYPAITSLMQMLGIGFLAWCGLRTLGRLRGQSAEDAAVNARQPRLHAISTMLAVTWLNPLVWLEAMFLVGVLASGYAGRTQLGFAAGFLAASAIKFYGWSLVGVGLSDLVKRPLFRRRLDIVSGLVLLLAACLLAAHMAG